MDFDNSLSFEDSTSDDDDECCDGSRAGYGPTYTCGPTCRDFFVTCQACSRPVECCSGTPRCRVCADARLCPPCFRTESGICTACRPRVCERCAATLDNTERTIVRYTIGATSTCRRCNLADETRRCAGACVLLSSLVATRAPLDLWERVVCLVFPTLSQRTVASLLTLSDSSAPDAVVDRTSTVHSTMSACWAHDCAALDARNISTSL